MNQVKQIYPEHGAATTAPLMKKELRSNRLLLPIDTQSVYNDKTMYEYDQVRNRMIIALVWAVAIAALSIVVIGRMIDFNKLRAEVGVASSRLPANAIITFPAHGSSTDLSPVFSPEIQHWGPKILEWARAYNLNPNAVATIMQIESCGDPQAESWAGAQGLFQVMPFHFAEGENMRDPDTNAHRGMVFFAERLVQTNGDVGLAFAGYNGGPGASASGWNHWVQETRDYYTWSTGIYQDAESGLNVSPTLTKWLDIGGGSLCHQAAEQLGLR